MRRIINAHPIIVSLSRLVNYNSKLIKGPTLYLMGGLLGAKKTTGVQCLVEKYILGGKQGQWY